MSAPVSLDRQLDLAVAAYWQRRPVASRATKVEARLRLLRQQTPALVGQAKANGKRVHMGRVNSERRLRYAAHIGCDSADGTFLAFGPDLNLPRLLAWLRGVNDQGDLFNEARA